MHRASTFRIFFLCAALTAFSAPACAQNMLGGLPIDGIRCDYGEGSAMHVHANLQMYNRGRAVTVPSNIGIPITTGCLYWVHTHSNNGMIHIEAPVRQLFTLGQFFDIWAVTLNARRAAGIVAPRGKGLRFTVNGRAWRGDPRLIPIRDHEVIVIQGGPPFATPRKPYWGML